MMTDRIEPLTRLEDVRAPHNVVSAVAGLEEARTMIEVLERAGVDAGHISLLGAQKAESADEVAEAALADPAGTAARGSAGGAAVGAGIGAIAGAAIGLPAVGPLVAGGLWAVFGGAVGGAIGGVSSVGLSQAWQQTFEAVRAGNVAVGVHGSDPDEIAFAFSVMEGLSPLSINRFDD